MQLTARNFYQFSGFHSFLIGLLPFFLPVILWDRGLSLAHIFAFIAITGIGFIATLWYWDRSRSRQQWNRIITLSFTIECLLVGLLAFDFTPIVFVTLALLNGAYNCFYWSTQRAIFSHITSKENTGKTFGNFQILVVILLKLGILAGGYLLENEGTLAITLLSLTVSSIALWKILENQKNTKALRNIDASTSHKDEPRLSLRDILHFKDNNRSKIIFLLDGPFLFLESYLWVLSIYLLTHENFITLGFVIVSLTLLLSVAFYFIKNTVDNTFNKVQQQKIFVVAVILYALSWFLRGQLDSDANDLTLYSGLLIIGFLTTFFRLIFNKRFFDIARNNTSYQYLICKSYYSQLGIAIFFGVMALLFSSELTATRDQINTTLTAVYFVACPLALAFILYNFSSAKVKQPIPPNIKQSLTPSQLTTKRRFNTPFTRLLNKR